jgi:hypothetical protein
VHITNHVIVCRSSLVENADDTTTSSTVITHTMAVRGGGTTDSCMCSVARWRRHIIVLLVLVMRLERVVRGENGMGHRIDVWSPPAERTTTLSSLQCTRPRPTTRHQLQNKNKRCIESEAR